MTCLTTLLPIYTTTNGVVERKKLQTFRCHSYFIDLVLYTSGYWVESFSIAFYLINSLSSIVIDIESPYFQLYHQKPNYRKTSIN